MADWDEVYETLPHNGQEGQPCPSGCIMARDKSTGKLILVGDCRNPGSESCAICKEMVDKE